MLSPAVSVMVIAVFTAVICFIAVQVRLAPETVEEHVQRAEQESASEEDELGA